MNENTTIHNCHSCGRPLVYREETKCNFCDACMCESPHTMLGCIKKDADPCKAKAVIPALTVETADGITNLANCFVHVMSNNTTYYIDDKHRPMLVWAGPVEVEAYDVSTNELGLRSQTLYTTVNDAYTEVYFDKKGVGHVIGTEA